MKTTIEITMETLSHFEIELTNEKGDTLSFDPNKEEGLFDFLLNAKIVDPPDGNWGWFHSIRKEQLEKRDLCSRCHPSHPVDPDCHICGGKIEEEKKIEAAFVAGWNKSKTALLPKVNHYAKEYMKKVGSSA